MKNGHIIAVVGCAAIVGLLSGYVFSDVERPASSSPATMQALQHDCAANPQDTACAGTPAPRALTPPAARNAPMPRADAACDHAGADCNAAQGASASDAATNARVERKRVEIYPDDPALGPASAKVSIATFTDFQCPFCARAAKTMERIAAEYADDVRVVLKHYPLPFHRDAPLAHQAAAEAHVQGRFWEYHDRLFENMKALKRDDLERYAQSLGLDMSRFRRALDEGTHAARVGRDIAQAKALGVTGTPSFFINGRFVSGAKPFEYFKQIIDEEMRM